MVEWTAHVVRKIDHMIPEIRSGALVNPEEDTAHGVSEANESGDIDADAEWPPGRELVIEQEQ